MTPENRAHMQKLLYAGHLAIVWLEDAIEIAEKTNLDHVTDYEKDISEIEAALGAYESGELTSG